ncbi:hypothetical protein F4677DRAFT_417727 [Hypoxylon crocopeplum]|nr:hypothetical protein F4677DRAFT_417727 [Hypoxylon crocopeplum]
MAYRVSPAEFDSARSADVNSLFDLDSASSIFNRPVFTDPFEHAHAHAHAHPPSPPTYNYHSHSNFDPADVSRQHHRNPQLPSLPDLLTGRAFPDVFDPFQQPSSLIPPYRHHNPSPPATNYIRRQERISWASTRSVSTFPRLDPGLRRLGSPSLSSSTCTEQQPVVAPPRTQQPRASSSTTCNTYTQLPHPSRLANEPTGDDYYLSALADGDFSSPSLPPISSSPLPPTRPQSSSLPKPLEVGEAIPTTRPRDRGTSKSGLVGLSKEEPEFGTTSGIDPTTPAMPPSTRKRTAAAAAAAADGETEQPAAVKRRRSSQSTPSTPGRVTKSRSRQTTQNHKATSPLAFDDLFGDPVTENDHEAIDLSNATEVPEEFMAPVDTRVKIGKFQCVICMDDASHLTVTHCGHLFCSECLHSALHIDNMKKTCPVCRTKVDTKEKKGKNTKSYYHLELKIMTATKKGKRPAGPS